MSRNRAKVAKKLVNFFAGEGVSIPHRDAISYLADEIWTAQGGATKLDVARWGVDFWGESEGRRIRVNVGSFATLKDAATGEDLKVGRWSLRDFEVY